MSPSIFFLILLAGVLYLMLSKGAKYSPPGSTRLPKDEERHYRAVDSLFVNKAERAFFIILSQKLGPDYLLMAKTRLEDIIGVDRRVKDSRHRFALRGRVKSRHVDFLICGRDGRPLLAIELDGRSHSAGAAQAGDDLKDRIFEAANLPFARVSTGENFETAARRLIDNLN